MAYYLWPSFWSFQSGLLLRAFGLFIGLPKSLDAGFSSLVGSKYRTVDDSFADINVENYHCVTTVYQVLWY